jgi:hypothetical protein
VSRRRDSSRKANNRFKRKVDIRKPRDNFLIVGEGEKTEPNYFRKFHGPIDVKVEGTGCNTIRMKIPVGVLSILAFTMPRI